MALEDSLEDGPVGFDAGDGRVLGVDVFGVRARHLGLVDHQTDGGGARTRRRGGSYADDFPIGPSGREGGGVISDWLLVCSEILIKFNHKNENW